MTDVTSSELIQGLIDNARLQSNSKIPNELGNSIQPVIEVNPRLLKYSNYIANGVLTNGTTTTVVTLETGRDFYLLGGWLSMTKDVSATTTLIQLKVVPFGGVTTGIVLLASLTITVDSKANSVLFPFPMKLERGSAVTITSTTNTGNFNSAGGIIGYYDETRR